MQRKHIQALIKPTNLKILIFLTPVFFTTLFFAGLILPPNIHSISVADIENIIQSTFILLNFPGSIICSLLPWCSIMTGYSLIQVNQILLIFSHILAWLGWYFIAAVLGDRSHL